MRIVILTSSLRGFASHCLPDLVRAAGIDVAMVIYSEGAVLNPTAHRKRKLAKLRKIGILGAINGVRMRRWFREDVANRLKIQDLETVANRLNVSFEKTTTINCQRTMDLFAASGADLGLSLGNSYIGEKVFGSLKHGMINVHHEVLPEFRGAQSVIWQIHEGSRETGYTIHQIDKQTDTGRILYREKVTMELRPTLRETVTQNYARLYELSAVGLVNVVSNYFDFQLLPSPALAGRSFTTPSFREYLRMARQHKRLRKDQAACSALLQSSGQ